MNSPDASERQRMQALVDLRDELVELHARLEFVRLMLRVGGGAGVPPGQS